MPDKNESQRTIPEEITGIIANSLVENETMRKAWYSLDRKAKVRLLVLWKNEIQLALNTVRMFG